MAERLERRLCLSSPSLNLPFQAANFSARDPDFILQPASGTNQRKLLFSPPAEFEEVNTGDWVYEPAGEGHGWLSWPAPGSKQFTRVSPSGGVAVGLSTSGISVQVSVDNAWSDASLTQYMTQVMQGKVSLGYTVQQSPGAAIMTWSIKGGAMAGRDLPLHGQRVLFRDVVRIDDTQDFEHSNDVYLFAVGADPSGNSQFIQVDIDITSLAGTTDKNIIPLNDVISAFFHGSVLGYDNAALDEMAPNLKLTGAVPDTLLLYDFSGKSTIPPFALPNINQFEQSQLPVKFGIGGGNACGPSSITMALDEVGHVVSVADSYEHTTEFGLDVAPETTQGFQWQKAQDWVNELRPQHSAIYRELDAWDRVDANLNAGSPVLVSDMLSVFTTHGSGHVILLLGVGKNPDVKQALREVDSRNGGDYYIVADPAGHFFANPGQGGMNTGHYGTVEGLRKLSIGINYGGWFAIYPKEQLHDWVDPAFLRTLTIDPAVGDASFTVHSPVSVVITDPMGRRTGVGPDGTVISDVPESEYHVAVAEEEESGYLRQLPEEGKSVVISSPMNGTYTAQLVGTGSGLFRFDVDLDDPGHPGLHQSFSGVAAPGVAHTYTFAFPPATAAAVVGRSVLYSGSGSAIAGAADLIVEKSKRALLPGQAASFDNITSFSNGINGVMIDVLGLPQGATLTANDFLFDTTTGPGVAGWSPGPGPSGVAVRHGAGPNHSDRVTLTWPDGAIVNQWLRVTVKPNANTGLSNADVFYFGNLVGETGGAGTPTVNVADVALTRANVYHWTADALARCDFNRDGTVDGSDLLIARNNQRRSLPLFTAPAAGIAPAGFSQAAAPPAPARTAPPRRRGLLDTSATVL